MRDIILLVVIMVIIINFVGLATCVEFYSREREIFNIKFSREKYLILSWLLQLLRNTLYLYVLIFRMENILFLITLIGFVAYYLLDIMGITSYYREINEKKAIYFLVIVVIFSVLVFFIAGNTMAVSINNIAVLSIQVYMIIAPLFNLEKFKSKVGTGGMWYYITFICGFVLIPITIYTNSRGYSWAVLNADNSFVVYLFHIPVIIAHIFLILFIVHME